MSKIKQIQSLVRNGLYYLTEHADDEAQIDNLNIYDVEYGLLNGKIRRTWPKQGKFEIVGPSMDNQTIGIICRITQTGKVRVITVYKDNPRN